MFVLQICESWGIFLLDCIEMHFVDSFSLWQCIYVHKSNLSTISLDLYIWIIKLNLISCILFFVL
ncbi:unnamed protein product [Coffea canephora]|uniref:DH200=94 genomic scaffold, scaffold_280 n=1 Tax=Coffea canephora TaxID=49390 RepID=A0A068VE00_COFCA|nr:unnamed protein product [Coffea canephora]